ncbi:MAG: hypothetical protein QMD23_02705 [Candidatus Bathyarchaeia archaeon]|nr:hypothetical protein [Candidatus Bathyarchaeia archaeon]
MPSNPAIGRRKAFRSLMYDIKVEGLSPKRDSHRKHVTSIATIL